MRPLDADTQDAYLRRLGVEPEPPSAPALARLHRAHAERIPYETWWIAGGETWDTDPHRAAARIAHDNRGGYCYHLNGAIGLLLAALGYDVRRHTGGVHGPDGPSDGDRGNHLVLTVAGLPTDRNPGGVWHVDVGLGDALHEPLPLVAGEHRQGLYTLTLAERGTGWHLLHDPAGEFRGMAWTLDPPDDTLLAQRHTRLCTAPESSFVKVGLAQTRHVDHVDVVRGLTLIRFGAGTRSERDLVGRREWFEALADLFGLTFSASAPGTRDRLWARVEATHQAWDAAGRP